MANPANGQARVALARGEVTMAKTPPVPAEQKPDLIRSPFPPKQPKK
jgi:hypothetical protein